MSNHSVSACLAAMSSKGSWVSTSKVVCWMTISLSQLWFKIMLQCCTTGWVVYPTFSFRNARILRAIWLTCPLNTIFSDLANQAPTTCTWGSHIILPLLSSIKTSQDPSNTNTATPSSTDRRFVTIDERSTSRWQLVSGLKKGGPSTKKDHQYGCNGSNSSHWLLRGTRWPYFCMLFFEEG